MGIVGSFRPAQQICEICQDLTKSQHGTSSLRQLKSSMSLALGQWHLEPKRIKKTKLEHITHVLFKHLSLPRSSKFKSERTKKLRHSMSFHIIPTESCNQAAVSALGKTDLRKNVASPALPMLRKQRSASSGHRPWQVNARSHAKSSKSDSI